MALPPSSPTTHSGMTEVILTHRVELFEVSGGAESSFAELHIGLFNINIVFAEHFPSLSWRLL